MRPQILRQYGIAIGASHRIAVTRIVDVNADNNDARIGLQVAIQQIIAPRATRTARRRDFLQQNLFARHLGSNEEGEEQEEQRGKFLQHGIKLGNFGEWGTGAETSPHPSPKIPIFAQMKVSPKAENPLLTDRFGRVHDYLRISLVDKCNLRCTYCMPENIRFLPPAQLMNADELVEIAKVFVEAGVRKIRLTGGEPLLRKDAHTIIRRLASLNVELAISTNGILLDEFLDLFEEIGLKALNISLDTLDAERFAAVTRRDKFQQVMDNVKLALQRGFHIKLNMVVMRGFNEDELADFVELGRHADLHLRFIEFMPFDGNKWEWEKVVSYDEILAKISAKLPIEKLSDKPHSTSKAYHVPGFKGSFAVISTMTQHFCSDCNRLRLTAEGKMRNCLFAKEETDLLNALRNGQDLRPLITQNVQAKFEKLGGLPEFKDKNALEAQMSKRAMVKIGG
jgi:GTP 3',8-cyclase